jgi:hypothetical protein
VKLRERKQEQDMSHDKLNPCNNLVTRLAAADGTLEEARSHELLDTELAREVLEAIVGGQPITAPRGGWDRWEMGLCNGNTNPYDVFCRGYRKDLQNWP